jgi:hypothetical protein
VRPLFLPVFRLLPLLQAPRPPAHSPATVLGEDLGKGLHRLISRTARIGGLLCLTLAFSSAASAQDPSYSDPLAGIYGSPATWVPKDAQVDYYAPRTGKRPRAVLTMALVPGANYSQLRRYHAAALQNAKSLGSGAAAAAQDLKIEPVLNAAVEILKERYPWLELMESVADAKERKVSLTLVFDIRSVLGRKRGEQTLAQFDIIVFDEQSKPVSRLTVEGRATIDSSNGYAFQAAAEEALDELQSTAKAYLN